MYLPAWHRVLLEASLDNLQHPQIAHAQCSQEAEVRTLKNLLFKHKYMQINCMHVSWQHGSYVHLNGNDKGTTAPQRLGC